MALFEWLLWAAGVAVTAVLVVMGAVTIAAWICGSGKNNQPKEKTCSTD